MGGFTIPALLLIFFSLIGIIQVYLDNKASRK